MCSGQKGYSLGGRLPPECPARGSSPAKVDSGELRVVGAAVLPFCIDPVCGRLYFWLGKERYNAKWAQGSEQWSCFGGKSQCKDEPAERIAAREFVEETAGMLPYFSSDSLPRTGFGDIEQSLRESNYLFRLVFYSQKQPRVNPATSATAGCAAAPPPTTPLALDEHDASFFSGDAPVPASAAGESGGSSSSSSSSSSYRTSVYVLYVKQLDWDPCASRRFRACFKLMQALPCTIRDPVRLEWLLQHPDIHIRRTPTTSSFSTPPGSPPAVPLASPLVLGAGDPSPAPPPPLVVGALHTPGASEEPGSCAPLAGAHALVPLAEHVSIEKFPCSPPCRAMCAAQSAPLSAGVSARVRELLVGVVVAPPDGNAGSAATTTGGEAAAPAKEDPSLPSGGYKLIVNKDYFEKQDIALWSVPQLQRACRSNGVLTTRNGRVERCRTSFIKQMCAVMSELAFHAPSMLDESW